MRQTALLLCIAVLLAVGSALAAPPSTLGGTHGTYATTVIATPTLMMWAPATISLPTATATQAPKDTAAAATLTPCAFAPTPTASETGMATSATTTCGTTTFTSAEIGIQTGIGIGASDGQFGSVGAQDGRFVDKYAKLDDDVGTGADGTGHTTRVG